MNSKRHISIIGGAGHVGFPLGLIFSSKGFKVSLIDNDLEKINKINVSKVPFLEENSQKLLNSMIRKKRIFATNQLIEVLKSKYIIVCIGTPINKQLNPSLRSFISFFYLWHAVQSSEGEIFLSLIERRSLFAPQNLVKFTSLVLPKNHPFIN